VRAPARGVRQAERLTSVTGGKRVGPMRARGTALVVALALGGVPGATASAQVQVPAKPQTTSLDSDAPPGSPPHWIPGDPWVMEHWLPYDETRLYELLGVDRGDVWRWLRDDTRPLAELARQKGWDPEDLAKALVEPWRGKLKKPSQLAVLQERALKTLTQGHMSQHMFFHSLHQDAIPSHATQIFGVANRIEWSSLRRSEMSPLEICRLNGISRGAAQTAAEARLRHAAAWGVKHQMVPAAQAKRTLERQLQQLPRWLQQTRYNGPPPLKAPRESPATASNYSNNAALSWNGREVSFESYEAKLTVAKSRGEIAVMARKRGAGAPVLASAAAGLPSSNYNPAMSADGRYVAFESAEGNLNFAKRYGEMNVFVRDLRRGRIVNVSDPFGAAGARSAYNPTISGDGRLVAYETYAQGAAGDDSGDVVIRDVRTGRGRAVVPPPGAGAASEPQLSRDGRRLAFTSLVSGRSEVFVQDVAGGRTRLASAGDEAWEPSLSADGWVVAYTAAGAGRTSHVVVRDLRSGRATTLESPTGRGLAYEPSLSGDGTRVAYVARPLALRRTQAWMTDVRARVTQLVSRGDGSATHPAISGDGRHVAFTSDAWNLSPAKCNPARGVFVRDVDRDRTRLVSAGDGANRYVGPTRGSSTDADAFILMLCA
jgi:Tol biopolymer transport system component